MSESFLSVVTGKPILQKDRQLFGIKSDWLMNACVSHWHGSQWIYEEGFRRAALRLAEHVCEAGRDQDAMVYPIVYLYRHHIELLLKSIIENEMLLLDQQLPDNEFIHHNLFKLWKEARSRLNLVCERANNPPFPENELEGVDSYVRQLHEHDPDGQRFRYAIIRQKIKINGKIQFQKAPSIKKDLEHINIRYFAIEMENLCEYLECISNFFGCLLNEHLEEG